jgi:enolase-phosphatase E1
VTDSNPDDKVTSILLDIEGTTTPIDFVYKTLFPYARTHMAGFITTSISSGQLSEDLSGLLTEHAADVSAGHRPPPIPDDWQTHPDSIVEYSLWLMDQDRKSTPLKSIQGKIWQAGYNSGELKSEVFPDVPPALDRWTRQGREISIYSSGSVLAQKLLFANTHAGDLTHFVTGYFDTNVGPKKESASYRQIAAGLGKSPVQILFLSDVVDELQAAKLAGLQTLLCIRPGNNPQADADRYMAVASFDGVFAD